MNVSAAVEQVEQALRAVGAAGGIHTFAVRVPTAAAAARELGCPVGAIANSLVFSVDTADGRAPLLVITSGAHRADLGRVAAYLGIGKKKIHRADPDFVLAATGQRVGGVAPVGHPQPVRTLVDTWLETFDVVWAGAGDDHSMFPTTCAELVRITSGDLLDLGEAAKPARA